MATEPKVAADPLDRLLDSLLYEGYALYPYTPGAAKNATPTPFGIVYPPEYAKLGSHTFDLARIDCVLRFDPEASDVEVRGEVRFLQAAGERHKGVERRVQIPPAPLERLIEEGQGVEFDFEAEHDGEPVSGRARVRAEALGEGTARVIMCVHNTGELPAEESGDPDRPAALRSSLLSTHLLLRAAGGTFVSPLENEGEVGEAVQAARNVNTWPVLASPDDDAVLGAAIFLPDHPKVAPESLGNLFDNTEIEEALLLHVKTLSEEERKQIAGQDPAVLEMIERAESATPEQLMELHGRLEMRDPRAGEGAAEVDGVTYRRGASVILSPQGGNGGDSYDVILAGRSATIERIFLDYEDGVHLGVTVDGDPGQDLMRDSGRYLFFRPEEVELA